MTKPTLLLEAHLKALRLPTVLREYDKVARHCAQGGLDCPRDLFTSASWSYSIASSAPPSAASKPPSSRS